MIFNRALRHTGQRASTPNAKKPLHADSAGSHPRIPAKEVGLSNLLKKPPAILEGCAPLE
jgi:hypothetical protein